MPNFIGIRERSWSAMGNLLFFSWLRIRRRFFWLIILGAALLISGAFFGITKWQLQEENTIVVRQLDRGSSSLAMVLYDVPAKPAKIPKGQVLYWHIKDAQKALLVAMHQASQAKTAGAEHVFLRQHIALLQAAQRLNRYQPQGAAAYTQLDAGTIAKELKRDKFLRSTSQTLMTSRYSLAPRALITRLWLLFICPPILIFLLVGLNWLWRDDFDTNAHQLLLLHVRYRRQVVIENILSTLATTLVFGLTSVVVLWILGALFGSNESIAWMYPLSPQVSLGQQAISATLFTLPVIVCLAAIVQGSTLLLHHLSTRIAVLVIVAAGGTFLPLAPHWNPFNQLGQTLLAWQTPVNNWTAGILLGIAIVLMMLASVLLNHRNNRLAD
ncbi:hypothetical protein [Schleiferilactobacillus harbinensis]|uniref:ABC transporter permease n=1 Tax=Schleiferilactobacillus harbinensis TaxID=304207 RepID=A0ABU7T282_9LACO